MVLLCSSTAYYLTITYTMVLLTTLHYQFCSMGIGAQRQFRNSYFTAWLKTSQPRLIWIKSISNSWLNLGLHGTSPDPTSSLIVLPIKLHLWLELGHVFGPGLHRFADGEPSLAGNGLRIIRASSSFRASKLKCPMWVHDKWMNFALAMTRKEHDGNYQWRTFKTAKAHNLDVYISSHRNVIFQVYSSA